MLIDYTSGNLKFKVGNYILDFPTNVFFETFNDPENYYGIIFKIDTSRYEVLECKLGTRLLINSKENMKDVPFHLGTADMLPKFINVKQSKELAS